MKYGIIQYGQMSDEELAKEARQRTERYGGTKILWLGDEEMRKRN